MYIEQKRRILRMGFCALANITTGAAIAAVSFSTSATAQDGNFPSNAESNPGELVYARDVPYGTATRRFVQGEERTVALDQTPLIDNVLLIGLEPLSDAEQAAVSAPLIRSLEIGQSAIDVGLSALASTGDVGDFTRSESGGGSVGGIVNQSLGALPNALGVISRTVGNGQ